MYTKSAIFYIDDISSLHQTTNVTHTCQVTLDISESSTDFNFAPGNSMGNLTDVVADSDIYEHICNFGTVYIRGQRPISGKTYFRHICSLGVNFMQLWIVKSSSDIDCGSLPRLYSEFMDAKLKIVLS